MPDDVSAVHPIVLFDGVCNLCEGYVQFLIRRDPDGVIRFAPLQSSVGQTLLAEYDLDDESIDSIVLIDGGEAYVKSSAVIRIGQRLGGVYRLLGPFRFVPRLARDPFYDFVAARRYDWFGRKDACMMPTPDVQARFLAGAPGPGGDE